jgi:type IV secretory pathway VirB2 component (pilin)
MISKFKNMLLIFLLAFSFNLATPELALADTPGTGTNNDGSASIVKVICNVIGIAQGNTGKTISILVVISMAIGLFLGKITWGVAIAVAVGMGVLFGANTMVGFISNTGSGTAVDPCKDQSNSNPTPSTNPSQ